MYLEKKYNLLMKDSCKLDKEKINIEYSSHNMKKMMGMA